MITFFKKILYKLFGNQIRLVKMKEDDHDRIMYEMSRIDGIEDYLELMKRAGYQLYSQTKDERHLGHVDLADTLLTAFQEFKKAPEEEVKEDGGYKPTIE